MHDMGLEVEKHHHEVAPSQNELGFVFSTLVRTADNMQIYKYVVHNVAQPIRQDRDLHAQAGHGRQRLGHACPPVAVEGRAPALRRQSLRRSVRDGALLHRRHHPARQGDQRLHQPDDQQLQAADPRLRGAGVARLFVAQPLGLLPHPLCRQPQGQAGRGALSRPAPPTPISPLPRC